MPLTPCSAGNSGLHNQISPNYGFRLIILLHCLGCTKHTITKCVYWVSVSYSNIQKGPCGEECIRRVIKRVLCHTSFWTMATLLLANDPFLKLNSHLQLSLDHLKVELIWVLVKGLPFEAFDGISLLLEISETQYTISVKTIKLLITRKV